MTAFTRPSSPPPARDPFLPSEELLGRLREQLLATLLRRGVDAELAEDLVQESLARIWRKFTSLRDPASLRSWATSIVLNRWRTHLQRSREHERVPDSLFWAGPEPEAAANRREATHWLQQAISELPPAQRLSLRLRVLDGLSITAGSLRLGVSRSCFRSHVQKAMRRLRLKASTRAGRRAAASLGLA